MVSITGIEQQGALYIFDGVVNSGRLIVGDDVEVRRDGQTVLTSTISGVLLGAKVMDMADEGDACRFLLRGPAAAEVREGDTVVVLKHAFEE